jgi:hypothetical protein
VGSAFWGLDGREWYRGDGGFVHPICSIELLRRHVFTALCGTTGAERFFFFFFDFGTF